MSDHFSETSTTGFLGSIGDSIKGALIGVVLFFASFAVLWWNEGRINWADEARTSIVAPADKVDATLAGKFVSVTSTLESQEVVGDPEFIAPGPWLRLTRSPEMWAWVEHKKETTEKNTGGSKTTTTTYDYDHQWTAEPKPRHEFKHPEGHDNPAMPVAHGDFRPKAATIGAYGFAPENTELPSGDPLPLGPAVLASTAEAGTTQALKGRASKVDGTFLFLGTGTVAAPQHGDIRILFRALARGTQATLFGTLAGSNVEAYVHKSGKTFLRALKGTREQAIQELQREHDLIAWIFRLVGFLCMWIGMSLVLDPIATVMDVLPALGSIGRAAIGIVCFPIALVLSAITIVVSMVLHSLLATIAVGVVGLVVVALVLKRKSQTT
jgi:hypothetical protein